MILVTIGNNWIAATHIYKKVGTARFRCSDCDTEIPRLKCYLRDMVDCGILTRYKATRQHQINEYSLTPEAVMKIKRYG